MSIENKKKKKNNQAVLMAWISLETTNMVEHQLLLSLIFSNDCSSGVGTENMGG